jgi:hypothetical protein
MDKDNLAYKKMTSTGATVTQDITMEIAIETTNGHMLWLCQK